MLLNYINHGIVDRSRKGISLIPFPWLTKGEKARDLMATIRKRGKSYQIDYFDPNGKRIRKSFKKSGYEGRNIEGCPRAFE